ncbi:sporulation protein YqfD [Lucifera butyrica]|nr:sporulation protein YqfD [Lucifera butyrica]
MLTYTVLNYINGIIRIRVSGTMPEKFINLCMAQNIFLWGIIKLDGDLYVNLRLPDFLRIRPLVKRSQTQVRVIHYKGLPFILKRIKHRKALLAGALLFAVILQVLSSYVWFVDISGAHSPLENEIREVLIENGLHPGVNKDKINSKALENTLLLKFPQLAWTGIHFTGTRAFVEVVEKTMPPAEDKNPSNIIADKDGIVTEIIAISGQPLVKKGDTVKKGDLLIKGVMPVLPPATGPEHSPGVTPPVPEQLVKAKGIVKARVWYEGYGEGYLKQEVFEPTGNQTVAIMLRLGSRQYILKQAAKNTYRYFNTEVIEKKLPWWRNSNFAVESNIIVYHELAPVLQEQSAEEARNEAKAKAMRAVQALVSKNAYILSRRVEVINTPEPNPVRVKASIEAIEDIGQNVSITQ